MNSWSANINAQIDNKLEGVREKDYHFFRVAEFKRNISRTDSFSNTCPVCKKEQQNIQEVVESIDKAINNPGRKRRTYDKLLARLAKHIQKEHGYYPPYYFTYMISFVGIVLGSILGYFLMQLNSDLKLELFCLGFAIGLLPTYVWGHLKDKKIRHNKKLM